MILKTFQVALLSFLLFIIPSVILEKYSEFKQHDFSYTLGVFLQIFFYGIPLLGLGFIVLLLINRVLVSLLRDKTRSKKNYTFFLVSLIIAILPIFGFILFDYSQRDRHFPPDNSFDSIFIKCSVLFVWIVIAIFLNRKIVWKNFENP
jgi:ABC-type dipeptide/oligopeptide/nickel transport system permease component